MEQLGQENKGQLGNVNSKKTSLVTLLVCSLMMFSFSLYGAQASVFEKARETILDVFEPVLTVLNAPIRFVDRRLGDIGDYFNALDENERLREENEERRAWMNEAITLRRQVSYYETLLDVTIAPEANATDAMVIGESGGPYKRSLILNVGRTENVDRGDAVIGVNGLIGHVVTVGNSSSRVLMLTDYSSRVPVFIEGAEIEAIVEGRYLDDPVLSFLNTRDLSELNPGMRIVTSGAGGTLPRGISVGRVGDLRDEEIKVQLFTNYLDTENVRVLDYSFVTQSPDDVEADLISSGEE